MFYVLFNVTFFFYPQTVFLCFIWFSELTVRKWGRNWEYEVNVIMLSVFCNRSAVGSIKRKNYISLCIQFTIIWYIFKTKSYCCLAVKFMYSCSVLLLLLIKRYNLYKVLACSMAFFQLSLFCAIFFQLRTFIFLISSKTSFSRILGLPIGLLDMGFHLLIFWTVVQFFQA